MPIKYGELTIVYNKEEISLFTSWLMWLQYEEKPPENSKYVFLFDDGEICESSDNWTDLHFKFLGHYNIVGMPRYFEKTNKPSHAQVYFYKKPVHDEIQKIDRLDFKPLFSSYSNYDGCKRMKSYYNSIYYCHNNALQPEVFGIVRVQSNDYIPRFQFAYDTEEFTKEEIIYLLHYIFTKCK